MKLTPKLRIFLLCAAALLFAVCLAGTVLRLLEKKQARLDHEQSLELAGISTVFFSQPKTEDLPQTLPDATVPATEEEPSVSVPETLPVTQFQPILTQEVRPVDPMAEELKKVNIAALQEKNRDVVGWIIIPGTEISYPLMQGKDNAYYLKHTWLKEKSGAGSIFADYRNNGALEDFNTIIYGHHLKDGMMFSALKGYRDEDYWQAHPAVYVVTEAGVKRYDVFAVYDTYVEDTASYRLGLTEKAGKQAYINYCLNHALFDTQIVPTDKDRLLTLSTCPKGTGNDYKTRLVVHAVLVFETEA